MAGRCAVRGALVAVLIVSLTASTSLRVGTGAALGASAADGLYALGGVAVVRLVEPVLAPRRWVAALVLVGIAVRTGVGALRRYREPVVAAPDGPGLGTPLRANSTR